MMKTNLLATLAILALSAIPSFGAINISFSYDPNTNTTTAYYSGSWVASFNNFSSYSEIDISPTAFYAIDGWFMLSGDDFEGVTFAWGEATADSQDGDFLAFDSERLYAPSGYVSGDDINGSLTFEETTLADLGLSLGQTDTYTSQSGNNTVSFEAVQVPETSTYAFGLGLVAIGYAIIRGRGRR
ncbi:hypothetical protein [Ruficoccus sp. ZRK36]|uniref:hypothetical protein n=1 Tax=Ruficoccus sp. ZRK36 TaxID=2866311 RepID=UPI001C732FCA|nr:hypothetical protein [Ruficoccus sp. ZRK36]QYY37038.1 hypothetical protein K0V07_06050 [Ruficoccus sp. ZRK36]